ncbi:endospore germination permease [bacterium LRH843]|nr:endospore germination permease [bacterium LRH843]
MIEKVKISNGQATILAIMVITGGNLLFLPSIFAKDTLQDGWIASLVGVNIGVIFVFLYSSLARRFPNLTFAEYSELILGKVFGKLVAFFSYIYFFILVSVGIRQIGDFILTQMLPTTPLYVVNLLFISVIVMGVRLGLETFARAAQLCFPFIIILFISLSVFSLPTVKPENFLPILETGIRPIFGSAVRFLGFTYFQLIALLMIFPSIERKEKRGRSLLSGSYIGGGMLIILTTLCIGALGADSVIRQAYPSYALAKSIYIGDFITRIEVILAAIWFLTVYFKSTLFFYVLSLGIAQTLKLNDYRSLAFPLGILTLVYSIAIYPNTIYALETEVGWNWFSFGMVIGLFFPLLLLGVATVRKL